MIDIKYNLSLEYYSYKEEFPNFIAYKLLELSKNKYDSCNMPKNAIAQYHSIGNGYSDSLFIENVYRHMKNYTKPNLLDIIGIEFNRSVFDFSKSILGIVISVDQNFIVIRSFEEYVKFQFCKNYVHNTCENFNKQYAQLLEMKEQYKDLI